jgi:UDP:flavonoid glycosyltransferase YjiC (YdhE family)
MAADVALAHDNWKATVPMKFALACYGTRGDVEPCAAVGRELLRRGHEVVMAVPPELIGFVESTGLEAIVYGPEVESFWNADFLRNSTSKDFFRNFWTVNGPIRVVRAAVDPLIRHWAEMSATLKSLADGADLLFTGLIYRDAAANVAEYHDIPLATLHHFPIGARGRLFQLLPPALVRSTVTVVQWLAWHLTKKADDAQRRELGLPKATVPAARRVERRPSLEIQAYDEVCFPELAAEWAQQDGRRPFVGTLTLELTTAADDEVASWIGAGTPPICFGFGSLPVESPTATVEMISSACDQLGERALICAAGTDFTDVPHGDHVKVVGTVNYAETFPACRAIVHHGGAGTTAASLRAGVPTLVLWSTEDQSIWGAQVKKLKVGTVRRFSATTRESLIEDLSGILDPECARRAREIASRMTTPAESVASAADLLEKLAQSRRLV